MATEKKNVKQASKRSATGIPIQSEQVITSNVLQGNIDWLNDHEFISPNEIYINSLGLLFCLITKKLINISFTNLYCRSLKITWKDLLIRERRNLKININSVEKCFLLNRLISEYSKDPLKFAQQTGELYEEIKIRMSSQIISTWTIEAFYNQVLTRRNLQCQRRLFYINHDEAKQPQSLLILQQIATTLCSQFINSCQINPTIDNYNNLKRLLQHCFIIILQPSIPECVAATKYEKINNTYIAKLNTRIICLLEKDIIEKYFRLSDVGVILYPFDRNVDKIGEEQITLKWFKRAIIDSDEILKTFFYVELESIELKKFNKRNSRPLYSTKLCQLQFQFKIEIQNIEFEENLPLSSQLFGLCSHARFYPEHIAKVFLHDLIEILQSNNSIIQPNIMMKYINLYHIRITGVELKPHSIQYIEHVLETAYQNKKTILNITSFDIYEDILAKIISQIKMYIDYPFLSTMYHDGLFLGICDSQLDHQLHGTDEHPHILLRFNTLLTHYPPENASVRFLVHNGKLIRATFHSKAFVDEMCRMICEANSQRAKNAQISFEQPHKYFHEFSLYFDEHLYRLDIAASPIKDAYQPLIPVLWNTMRINKDEETEQQLNSPYLSSELLPVDLSRSNSSPFDKIQIDLSNIIATTDPTDIWNEKIIIKTDLLIHHLVEKLSDLINQSSSIENLSSTSNQIIQASELLSQFTGDNQQQKELISQILFESFQPKSSVEVATQTSNNSDDI